MVVADGQAPRAWNDGMAERFALLVTDLGGSFRRLQALLYERLAASDEGYLSRRLTVTSPDGGERSQVLMISDRDREIVGKHLDPVIEDLMQILGSRAAVCQTLLAHLVTEEAEAPGTD